MDRIALLVGINSYDKLNPLNTPAEDAEAVARLLTDYGDFKVRRLPEILNKGDDARRYPHRVGRKTHITFKQLEDALIQLFTPEGDPPDTALFCFSGHGLQRVRGRIREGYLATSNAIPEPDNNNWGLSLKFLRELLQTSPVRQQLVWLDCCYSGELFNFKEVEPEHQDEYDRCFITASRAFEVAYEQTIGNHGVLTGALLQGLDPTKRQDGLVTNYTLANFINQVLEVETQSPLFHNSGKTIVLTRTLSGYSRSKERQEVCPYKALEYFQIRDADFFYGRTALTDELIQRISTETFLAVLGASGSGKSSVLRAGLLHQLKLGQKLARSDRWLQVPPFTPQEHPLESLTVAIGRPATELQQFVEVQLECVVLVIDQFEECFTLCQEEIERQQFFDLLLNVLESTNKLRLVIGMRADFLGKAIEYRQLAEQVDQHVVTIKPMTSSELQEAITEPAKKVGLDYDQALPNRIVEEVEDSPGSLPLLQFTLTKLWEKRGEYLNSLSLLAYDELGGIKGTLERVANEVYKGLLPEQQNITKRIFLELTQIGEGTVDSRRRALKNDLISKQQPEELLDKVLQKLVAARLIVVDKTQFQNENSKVSLDVAHETLIRHWSLLRKWLDENRDKLKQKRKVEAAAEVWRERRAEGYLFLLKGEGLREAAALQQEQTGNLMLSDLAQEFVDESIRQECAQIRQKRSQRRKLIAYSFAITLGLSTYLAIHLVFTHQKNQRIAQNLQVIESVEGQGEHLTRIEALQALVKDGATLKEVNFKGIDLRGIDFYGADFKGADLRGIDFSRANLRSANFSKANLSNANLSNTNLTPANFSNANLSNANLSGAYLAPANFSNANLSDADLSDANLSSAYFGGANLSSANLSSANLRDTYLSDPSPFSIILVKLNRTSGANLNGAKLRNANLNNTNLNGADLNGADLGNARNLTPEEVKSAQNWENAKYDEKFRRELGLQ